MCDLSSRRHFWTGFHVNEQTRFISFLFALFLVETTVATGSSGQPRLLYPQSLHPDVFPKWSQASCERTPLKPGSLVEWDVLDTVLPEPKPGHPSKVPKPHQPAPLDLDEQNPDSEDLLSSCWAPSPITKRKPSNPAEEFSPITCTCDLILSIRTYACNHDDTKMEICKLSSCFNTTATPSLLPVKQSTRQACFLFSHHLRIRSHDT